MKSYAGGNCNTCTPCRYILSDCQASTEPVPAPPPPAGSIIPYSSAYLHMDNATDTEVFIGNDWFVMPRNGTLQHLTLSLEILESSIRIAETGTVGFRVYTSPLAANAANLVASGAFTPLITQATLPGTFLVANWALSIPVSVTSRIGIALWYSTDVGGAPYSTVSVSLYGGLSIIA